MTNGAGTARSLRAARGVEFPRTWSVNAALRSHQVLRALVGSPAARSGGGGGEPQALIDGWWALRKAGREPRATRHRRRTPKSSATSSLRPWFHQDLPASTFPVWFTWVPRVPPPAGSELASSSRGRTMGRHPGVVTGGEGLIPSRRGIGGPGVQPVPRSGRVRKLPVLRAAQPRPV